MIRQIIEYLKYLTRCFHLHGIHSPFIFELIEHVFKEKTPFYSFDEIESIRAKLLLTEKKIHVEDLGAGSKKNKEPSRKISEIAKSSLKRPKYSQLLYRLVYHFKPETNIELGTSFGISTAYMAKANPKAQVVTIEGSPEIAKVAEINFTKLELTNIKLVVSDFEQVLKKELNAIQKVDFVFFDGNHQKAPTLEYFKLCLNYAHDRSVFIFDDIYWSSEMKEAWLEIKKHPKVKVTLDCFEMGLVFFKKEQAKEHFTVYH